MGGAVPPLPQYAFMAWCAVRGSTGIALPLPFAVRLIELCLLPWIIVTGRMIHFQSTLYEPRYIQQSDNPNPETRALSPHPIPSSREKQPPSTWQESSCCWYSWVDRRNADFNELRSIWRFVGVMDISQIHTSSCEWWIACSDINLSQKLAFSHRTQNCKLPWPGCTESNVLASITLLQAS
jgi:hypothetical protein